MKKKKRNTKINSYLFYLSIFLVLLVMILGFIMGQKRNFNRGESSFEMNYEENNYVEKPRETETDEVKKNTKPSNKPMTNSSEEQDKEKQEQERQKKEQEEQERKQQEEKKKEEEQKEQERKQQEELERIRQEEAKRRQEEERKRQEEKDDPGNTMAISNYCKHSEAAFYATELHFIKMSSDEINRRYNNATAKDVIRWVGDGNVKTWTEGKIMYVASPKKIYFTDGTWLRENQAYSYDGSTNISFGNSSSDNVNNYANGCGFGYLRVIDFANVDTSKMTYMGSMFAHATRLEEIRNLTNFNTSNVTIMSQMFMSCPKLKSIDLSSFDTSRVKLMNRMFFFASSLEKVYISNKWSTKSLNYSNNIFGYEGGSAWNLKGGNGTLCKNTSFDTRVAKADLPGSPGCFTLK